MPFFVAKERAVWSMTHFVVRAPRLGVPWTRLQKTKAAKAKAGAAKSALETNLDFELGAANLMF